MGEITTNGFSPPFTPLMPKTTTLLTIFETTLSKTSLLQMAIVITASPYFYGGQNGENMV